MKKYYKILGLKEGASKKEIQINYNRLLKDLDPKNNDNQEFFIEETKKIKDAYEKLMNSSILSTKQILDKSNIEEDVSQGQTNNVKPKSIPKKKLFFSKDNLILTLIIVLLGHSFYLQILVSGALSYARSASSYAEDASSYAEDASSYAEDASSNAEDASSYAYDAASYAEKAYTTIYYSDCN